MVCNYANHVYVCTGECVQYYHRIIHKQTNCCFSLIFYFNLCDSVGSYSLQMQKGIVGMLNRSGCRKSKLGREKMGFLGALDRKVNGFMRWQ